MPTVKINKRATFGSYYLTLTIKNWYYIFDRHNRWEILADSLRYCKENKGIKLFGFVFMLNHIHLVVMSEDVIGFLRDFKKFTSKRLYKNIQETEPNVLKIFIDEKNRYQFWKPSNMPKQITSEKFLLQKLEYIHGNPVRKRYVNKPEDWYWSSANPNCRLKADPLLE